MGLEYKLTGIFQLSAILIIIFYLLTDTFPKSFALGAVLFFIIKGIAFATFKQNLLSALDTIAGIYLFFPIIGWFSNIILNIIMILFLVQKGITYLFR